MRLFSERTGWDREEGALAAAVIARRSLGLPVLDLTASNPTRCGFAVDEAAVLRPLAEPAALAYDPQPFGRPSAREAVAGYYRERGALVPADDLCLTTSTSEAYSFLFRLLCNPGDEVLIASPSYPLFDSLATLEDVRLVSYPLLYEHGWQLQSGAIEPLITARTRAIALVHPNNPTGHYASQRERAEVETLCEQHGLALIVDEVFLDYAWSGAGSGASCENRPEVHARSFACGPHPLLTFVLSGMSKVAALPQMKLSWLAMLGPEIFRNEARERLEVIADTFLSVNAPVQQALPAWLRGCGGIQAQILARVTANIAALDQALAGTAASRLQGEGGWYAVVRIPAVEPDEAFALALLAQSGVLVHLGAAFGFASAGWLVLSLLPGCRLFQEGADALGRFVLSRYG